MLTSTTPSRGPPSTRTSLHTCTLPCARSAASGGPCHPLPSGTVALTCQRDLECLVLGDCLSTAPEEAFIVVQRITKSRQADLGSSSFSPSLHPSPTGLCPALPPPPPRHTAWPQACVPATARLRVTPKCLPRASTGSSRVSPTLASAGPGASEESVSAFPRVSLDLRFLVHGSSGLGVGGVRGEGLP